MKHYILKVLRESLKAHKGFQWPSEIGAVVTAPDWKPTEECGNGLHGWLNGQGYYNTCCYFSDTAKWLVLSTDSFIDLNGKVKFQSCVIECIGTQQEASDFLQKNSPEFSGPVIGKYLSSNDSLIAIGGDLSTLTAGYGSKLTGGNRSTLTAGYGSELTGGDLSTLTAGDDSILTGGEWAILTGGDGSRLTAGDGSTLTAGDDSILTGGEWAILTGGDRSELTGGDRSELTGGDDSILTAGYRSKLTGGDGSELTGGYDSTLICKYYDGNRFRTALAYVGEKGIKPNVTYKVNEKGEFIKHVE